MLTLFCFSIDDDLWAETADPNTGSVFFVTPKPNVSPSTRPPTVAASSSSSSSLSSSTMSIGDLRPVSPISARYVCLRVNKWQLGWFDYSWALAVPIDCPAAFKYCRSTWNLLCPRGAIATASPVPRTLGC